MIFTANQELIIRLSVFLGVFVVLVSWELVAPRRSKVLSAWKRRGANLLLMIANAFVLRLLLPLAALSMATLASVSGWGLLNSLAVNIWLAGILSFLLFDLLIYFQHRLMHKISFLWRIHRVHHSDTDIDVTTGVRFHPLEILLSLCIKITAVLLIGPPLIAVIVFEVVLSSSSLFNHANIFVPLKVEGILRNFIVTPDMHRVHHSVKEYETNSNFGFNISLWDRLFGSYRAQPEDGHQGIIVGLKEFRGPEFVNVLWLFRQPLLNSAEFASNYDRLINELSDDKGTLE
ncbi:MAG: sterol desaturase family protein [Gammaproteobacteria bacterium]|nr:sterol desaturase family protein [Gammaproteobacteria bacterium]